MKNTKLTLLALSVAVTGFFSFMSVEGGSIKGTVTPADAASTAWAVSATDTLKDAIENGVFEITGAKAGTYTVIIEAKAPSKNASKEGVVVTDGKVTEVGEIKLPQ
ncbi:MAG: carboxypeptidase regulatory-like domain-containing protein [Chitinophagaceae bacterium]|nr:carboxypeptidase regulatory-like domain-containing protein [Chitinophagaceae bacterium]